MPLAITFDFFSVNDLHGKFKDTDVQPGVDELTTYLKQAKAENPNTLFLSAGDIWQGAPESNLTKGQILTEWMNDVGFTAMTLGNHEYDWGEEYIEANAELAEFPFLAINVYDVATNQLVDYCQPSVMVQQNGINIGIIGAIGDCYSSISSDKVEDVYFKTGSQLTALVKAESTRLRNEGADFIIYALHDGYGSSGSSSITDSELSSYYDISLSDGYVDLVFEGHTHKSYILQDSKGVYHLQGGGDNDGISHAQVKINWWNDYATVTHVQFIDTDLYDNMDDDTIVNELLEKYAEQIAIANKKLGYNSAYRSSNVLRQTVADLYLQAGVEKWGNQYNIVLGGGFLSVRDPYTLSRGEVLYGDLQNIFPFDNPLVLCSISGYYLKSKFINTTNKNYFTSYSTYGNSIKNSIVNGNTYYVIVDTYTSQYTSNHLTEVARYDETTYARDLLATYIEKGGFN
jgi:2',3'-cyclic-nucleotide 2'-phosphodiesterase/3'-nucleotidase